MKLPGEDITGPVIQEQFKELFAYAEKFWVTASPLIRENDVVGAGNNRNLNICVCGAIAKQMRLYYAAVSLCRSGLAHEANLVLRTMLYTSVYLLALYRSDDKQKFSKMWIMWDFAISERNYFGLKTVMPNWPELKGIGEFSEEIRKELPPERWGNFLNNGPAMVNFRELCVQSKFEEAYLSVFRITSSVAHGSDLMFYSKPQDDGSIVCQLSQTGEEIEQIIVSAAVLLRDACVQAHDLLNLNNEELKMKIMESFEEYKTLNRKS